MTDQTVNTRSQIYWNTLLKIPTQAAAFVVSILVARILMPSDYGIMGVAMMLIGFANLFTDFGFSTAIVQKDIRDRDTLQSVFTFNLGVSAALAVLFSLSARFVAVFFKSAECENVVIVMSSVFVVTSFSAVPRAILRRDMDFKTLSLIDTASAISMSLLTLLLALYHFRYWALALGQLVPTLVFTIYLCVRVRWTPVVVYKHSSMEPILNFGVWNAFKTQLEFGLGHFDKMILGRYAGLTALGYYDKAISIAMVPADSLIATLNAVLFSSFSQRQHDTRELQDLFKKALMTISVLVFPVYVGLFVVAPYFVLGLLGEKWAPMIAPFQIIAITFLFRSVGSLVVATNVAVGRYRAYTVRYFTSGCVFIALCAVLVSRGTFGVALAFLLFGALNVALGLHLAVSTIELPWFETARACWPATKATACMFGLTELVTLALPGHTPLSLLAIAVTGVVAYGSCLALETDRGFLELRRDAVADLARVLRPR
jgi:O-antigen/teichoic acid export membrane protein